MWDYEKLEREIVLLEFSFLYINRMLCFTDPYFVYCIFTHKFILNIKLRNIDDFNFSQWNWLFEWSRREWRRGGSSYIALLTFLRRRKYTRITYYAGMHQLQHPERLVIT